MGFNILPKRNINKQWQDEHADYDDSEYIDDDDCEAREKPVAYCDMCGLYFLVAGDKCPKCGEVDPDVFYHLGEADLADYYENGGVLSGSR